MSVENFKKFGQMCAEDKNVREKVKEIGIDNVEGWITYSRDELGLEFDTEDVQALAAEEVPSLDELNEDQLEQIAGGVVTSTGAAVAGAAASVAGSAVAVTDRVRRGW